MEYFLKVLAVGHGIKINENTGVRSSFLTVSRDNVKNEDLTPA